MSDEKKPSLHSRVTTDGLDRTPHRAFLRGMGLDDEAIAKPFIGVVTTAGETTPCVMNLVPQAAAAKKGVVPPAAHRENSRRFRSLMGCR